MIVCIFFRTMDEIYEDESARVSREKTMFAAERPPSHVRLSSLTLSSFWTERTRFKQSKAWTVKIHYIQLSLLK